MPRLSRLGQAIPLIDRYVLRELLPSFLGGIGIFSALGVSAAVLFDLLRQVSAAQLPMGVALTILALQLPYFVSLSIPMSVLLACLLTFSRLQTDGELMALQAAGLPLGRLMRASGSFALLAMLLMLILTESVVPASQTQVQQLLIQTAQQGNFELQEQHILYEEVGPNQALRRLFYAQAAQGQTLYGLTVIDWTSPQVQQVIVAESATWNAPEHLWTFKNGTIYAVAPDGQDPSLLAFAEQQLQLPQSPMLAAELNPNTMTLTSAQQALAMLRQRGDLPQSRALEIQIHRKIALPFTVLVFGWVGSALGMRRRRLSVSNGFGLSLIFVLGQYLLIFMADAGGRLGWISPWWGAWLPNLVTGVGGLGLFLGLPQRKQFLS
ncbi:LptF/LptG family permease [Acaryochloris sp. IP29b_bin.148]|uniref:LptF/LptG family permease n=1 Tax=Acaryochloris sp. IP29b_bin.148 TaxID=2969218 RepID=UPI00261C8D27|nr:LptF/LptG family permease [Acaryochloris sp. IP29b_bin.148]